jgi:hypothetical protein
MMSEQTANQAAKPLKKGEKDEKTITSSGTVAFQS